MFWTVLIIPQILAEFGVFRIIQKCYNGGGMLRWVRRRLIFEKVGAWEKL